MSKQANPLTIGLFVIGACALVLATVVILGSGKFFKSTTTCIMFFEGSVNGLSVGAPVAFRGVQIGQVTEILLQANRAALSFSIPVVVEIDPDKIVFIDRKTRTTHEYLTALIKKGLRAQLQTQSIVTGLLFINLDFRPDTEEKYVKTDETGIEIPTIPSQLQEISRTLESIPISDLVSQLSSTLHSINQVVDNQEARQFFSKLSRLVEEGEESLKQANKILAVIDEHADPTLVSLQRATESAAAAGVRADRVFADLEDMLSDDSLFRYRLDGALESVAGSMRSFQTLSDYLDRHPNSLLFGKDSDNLR